MIRNVIWITLSASFIPVAHGEVAALSDSDLPVKIEVTQDVQVRSSEQRADGSFGQQRGTLYAAADFWIGKGQWFHMVRIGQEGKCRIRFQDAEHDLSSCPWLSGFRDHQEDIFVVLLGDE